MDKISQKKNMKYKNILDASYTLFEKNGAKGVSIDDIVKAAGVAKGTFYLYFKDKYELVSKLILQKADEYMTALQNDGRDFRSDNCGEHIRDYIDMLVDFLEKNITLTRLIDKNVHTCVNTLIENRAGLLGELYDRISAHFEKIGYKREEVEIKMYLFIDLIVSSCCNAILRGTPYKPEQIKPHLYDIIAFGMKFGELSKEKNI